jgi:hypothetical protein
MLGFTRIYTPDGRVGPETAGQPMMVVAPSLDQRRVDDPETLARTLVASLEAVREAVATSTRRLDLGRLTAIESVGRARDSGSGAALGLYQLVILPSDGGYLRVVGLAPDATFNDWLETFRRIGESVRPAK